MDSTSTPMGAAAGATPQPIEEPNTMPVDSATFDTNAPLDLDELSAAASASDFSSFDTNELAGETATVDPVAQSASMSLADQANVDSPNIASQDDTPAATEGPQEHSEIGEVTGLPDEEESDEPERDPNEQRPDIDVPNNGSEFSPTFAVDAKELAKVADASKEKPQKSKKPILLVALGVVAVLLVGVGVWFINDRSLNKEGCFDGHCFTIRTKNEVISNHKDTSAIWYLDNNNESSSTQIYLDPGCIFAKNYENIDSMKKEAKKLGYSSTEISLLDNVQIVDYLDTKAGLVEYGDMAWIFFCTADKEYTWGIMSYNDNNNFETVRDTMSIRDL